MTEETIEPIRLSKRMVQLLDMLVTGATNAKIASEMFLSEHTVKVHIWRLYQRIGVKNRGSAVAWWIKTNGNTETLEQAFERGRQQGRKEVLDSLSALPAGEKLNAAEVLA
jgi:DNA-binding CsgD family transcriptional regulator